ncbi:CRR6 family NdhI maturation factor [Ancylothrix sp. C2]|uniref:CRR6 family NdhI maturation factor n=1 Tax=Ancylothrix sp. D3o TaxID=2953691 RepID=UPI0021BB420E|nr:CRR6 family NdhI maturation factor [Ancylothrix sp. D3o]MCT7952331.1 CRR6 family NdhI maturation factor [Ancylothrix sp. D3o]
MLLTIPLNSENIDSLDLSPAQTAIEAVLAKGSEAASEQLSFEIDYPTEPEDPRELSEIPEVRLWFLRLDARYPWLPVLLMGNSGELARYTAMLVPHQFHRTEGIQFNPEALEIFIMQKIFVVSDWLFSINAPSKFKLMALAQMLGYELDEAFFEAVVMGNK